MLPPVPAASGRALFAATALGAAILLIFALALGRLVFAPLCFAILVIAIVWPVQARLQRWMPASLALLLTILATCGVLVGFGWSMTWAFTRVGRLIVADSARFQELYGVIALWLEGHGIVIAGMWAEYFNASWILRIVQQTTGVLNSTLRFLLVALIYIVLGLLEVGDIAGRVRRLDSPTARTVLLEGGARTAAKFRHYMAVRTLVSALTGLAVAGFVALWGLPLSAEWGVTAFVLNYIPVIGPMVATVLPTVFAAAELQSWGGTLTVFLGLNLIQFALGSYLEPRLAGSFLSMSPFLVLFAVFFWTFLWGVVGAVIGVPIMIAIITLCDQHPSSRWVATLFGASTDPAPAP